MVRSRSRHLIHLGTFLPAMLLLGMLAVLSGCSELVHEGQISDREGGFAVNDASIEQRGPEGNWRLLDKTDGHGRWWIMKERIKGGGAVRISKPGYFPLALSESEFLQSANLVMSPTGGSGGDEGGDSWGDEMKRRPNFRPTPRPSGP